MVSSRSTHHLGESFLAVCPLVALLAGTPAFAQDPDACREAIVSQGPLAGSHPRVESRTLTVDGVDYPFNVLLPSGYASGTRYPVLYLLHGATQNQDSWLSFSDIEAFTGPFQGADAAIVVMPVGDPLGISLDGHNSRRHWETLYVHALIPYIDANFNTLDDRAHRVIAGLSMGGVSAMIAAARHPDLFVAAGSFSGSRNQCALRRRSTGEPEQLWRSGDGIVSPPTVRARRSSTRASTPASCAPASPS